MYEYRHHCGLDSGSRDKVTEISVFYQYCLLRGEPRLPTQSWRESTNHAEQRAGWSLISRPTSIMNVIPWLRPPPKPMLAIGFGFPNPYLPEMMCTPSAFSEVTSVGYRGCSRLMWRNWPRESNQWRERWVTRLLMLSITEPWLQSSRRLSGGVDKSGSHIPSSAKPIKV